MSATMRAEAVGWTMVVGQDDDGLATLYDVDLGASPGHIAFKGIGRLESDLIREHQASIHQ